jgi:hypothetical protein
MIFYSWGKNISGNVTNFRNISRNNKGAETKIFRILHSKKHSGLRTYAYIAVTVVRNRRLGLKEYVTRMEKTKNALKMFVRQL